jgi:hypothetical protein
VPEGIVSWPELSSQLLQPGDNLCGCLHFLDLSLKDRSVRDRVIALCSAPHTGATANAPDEQASGCNSRPKGNGFNRSAALGLQTSAAVFLHDTESACAQTSAAV